MPRKRWEADMPEGIAEGIGASVRRKEDRKFITGRGRYTDDINRAGQLHAFFVRSDVAHAKIKSVDINPSGRETFAPRAKVFARRLK